MAVSYQDTFNETFRELSNKLEIYKVNSVTSNGPHTAFICNDGKLLYCHIGLSSSYGIRSSDASGGKHASNSME